MCDCVQKPEYTVLSAIGIAAVGCTTVASMTEPDAARLKALNALTPSVPDFLEPLHLPANLDSQLPLQPHPASGGVPQAPLLLDMPSQDQLALEFERQRSAKSGLSSRPLPTGAGRGRPRKEPKMKIGKL